jgi:hypothetical protein
MLYRSSICAIALLGALCVTAARAVSFKSALERPVRVADQAERSPNKSWRPSTTLAVSAGQVR